MRGLNPGDFFSVMYHYVRPAEATNLRILTVEKFQKQLDFIEKNFGFVSQEDWERYRHEGKGATGALLTFDDGLSDHARWVAPELQKRGIFAIFYVCSNPTKGLPLAVHIAHYLLAQNSAHYLMDCLTNGFNSVDFQFDDRALRAYQNQDHSEMEKNFKRIINWSARRQEFIEPLYDLFVQLSGKTINNFVTDWYLGESDIRHLVMSGFEVGSHTCSHNLLSDQCDSKIRNELLESKQILTDITGSNVQSFCFPYGGKGSYNSEILDLINQAGYSEAISVEPKPIIGRDGSTQERFELPRYDCNTFPYGTWSRPVN